MNLTVENDLILSFETLDYRKPESLPKKGRPGNRHLPNPEDRLEFLSSAGTSVPFHPRHENLKGLGLKGLGFRVTFP